MNKNDERTEWRQFMNHDLLQHASDPSTNIQDWCDWRLQLNNILCDVEAKHKYNSTRAEILAKQIMNGARWSQKTAAPTDSTRRVLTMSAYLNVYYGLPRLNTTLNNIRATREYTATRPRDQTTAPWYYPPSPL